MNTSSSKPSFLPDEVQVLFTALMFYTRIPCPSWVDHNADLLNRSRKYFPVIGWIIGGIAMGVYALLSVILPPLVAVLASLAATVYATGAFHEDGFADMCDGFGGGWTKEHILTIMKDSRLGTYGSIGLMLLLSLKVAALYQLAITSESLLLFALLNGHTSSRFIASTFIQTHEYVQDPDQSKAKPITSEKLSGKDMALSGLFTLLPLLAWGTLWGILPFLVSILSKHYMGRLFVKKLGGYTGDCLGASQQVAEVVFTLTLLASWTYM